MSAASACAGVSIPDIYPTAKYPASKSVTLHLWRRIFNYANAEGHSPLKRRVVAELSYFANLVASCVETIARGTFACLVKNPEMTDRIAESCINSWSVVVHATFGQKRKVTRAIHWARYQSFVRFNNGGTTDSIHAAVQSAASLFGNLFLSTKRQISVAVKMQNLISNKPEEHVLNRMQRVNPALIAGAIYTLAYASPLMAAIEIPVAVSAANTMLFGRDIQSASTNQQGALESMLAVIYHNPNIIQKLPHADAFNKRRIWQKIGKCPISQCYIVQVATVRNPGNPKECVYYEKDCIKHAVKSYEANPVDHNRPPKWPEGLAISVAILNAHADDNRVIQKDIYAAIKAIAGEALDQLKEIARRERELEESEQELAS